MLTKIILPFLVLFSVFFTLPNATQCETSYYEKYYSARRFLPIKKASLLDFTFTLRLDANERLSGFEQVALTGDQKQLGEWNANQAILLNRTDEYGVWNAKVQLLANSSIHYRYFIAAIDKDTREVQILRWESSLRSRSLNVSNNTDNITDTFGWIENDRHEVQRGWLNSGSILQLKLFRNPIVINETLTDDARILVKLQPIDPWTLTAILPSARAHSEYVRMAYGDSYLREQPTYGVPYNKDDILIFHTTLSDLYRVAFILKVYVTQANSDLVRLIGYQHILPDSFNATEGNININLISPIWLNVIGNIQLQYLVITPMSNGSVDFHTTFVNYWRSNWTALDAGHRGLGKSLTLATTSAPALIENTVASMKAAGELGADIVEFDIHLTSDLVPIIFHDYFVYVCMDPKTPKSKDDLTQVLIKDVTYEQLKNLKTYQVVGNKIIEYPAHNAIENEDQRLFPLFEDFLIKLNKTIGFDIEIKWPQLKLDGEYESIQTIDKNLYIDRILEVMQRHGCGRLSFFTSFDADICTLLRFKQNMYPVMFLSSTKLPTFVDPRSDSITATINNAQAFDLAGIVPNAVHIKEDPKWIEIALKQQKKIFLWGNDLKDEASIEWFKLQGPTGVIYDRMDLWLPINKENVFNLEADLPEFFQQQCSALEQNVIKERNTTIDSILSNVNML